MAGAIAIVNARLRKAGRQERLVRGHGYVYLSRGEAARMRQSGFYGRGDWSAAAADSVWTELIQKFSAIDVDLKG